MIINIIFTAIGASFFVSEKVAMDYNVLFYILRLLPEFTLRYYLTITFIIQWNFEADKIDDYYWIGLIEIIFLFILLIGFYENIYFRENFNRMIHTIKNVLSCDSNVKKIDNHVSEMTVEECDLVDACMQDESNDDCILTASKLCKTYANSQQAVKGIDFAVKKGECFGLLGMNGAGKTTTFKMMTLNSAITSGNIEINGYNSTKNSRLYSQQFGYCPEGDALLDFLTAYETLKYIAWIKGIEYNQLEQEVNMWLRKVDLMQYKNVPVYQYSGGTKRKLNAAIAMIGSPNLVYLDEPTTGVDPVSRRFMWHCIKEFQNEKKTVVLTSHR